MAFPISPLVDDELALIQYLRTASTVTDLIPGERITTELGDKPVYPVVLVNRSAGTTIAPGVDEPAVQVDVIGGTKGECKRLTQAVRSAVLAIANDTVPAGTLSSADEEMGPAWLPDTVPVPPLPRYVFRVRLLTHL